MKSNIMYFIVINVIVCYFVLSQLGVLTYIGIVMMVVTHEMGHYIFALLKNRTPRFIISSSGDPGVNYKGERSMLILSGGMIFNFLSLPIFIYMMNIEYWYIPLFIIGGSLSDIAKIMKRLRNKADSGGWFCDFR